MDVSCGHTCVQRKGYGELPLMIDRLKLKLEARPEGRPSQQRAYLQQRRGKPLALGPAPAEKGTVLRVNEDLDIVAVDSAGVGIHAQGAASG